MTQPTKSNLKYHDQFVRLLRDYRPNQQALELLAKTQLVLLVAPTSSGRNTLIDCLVQAYDYHFLLSDTTRQPRTNDGVLEVSGQRYWFLNEQQFLANLEQANLIEAAIIHNQQVSGIHLKRLQKAAHQNRPAVTDIDIQGYLSLKAHQPSAWGIFILPPNFDEWLRRLESRGKLTTAEKHRRLLSAKTEIAASLDLAGLSYVINDDLEKTCAQIDQLVSQSGSFSVDQLGVRQLAKELLNQLQDYLSH